MSEKIDWELDGSNVLNIHLFGDFIAFSDDILKIRLYNSLSNKVTEIKVTAENVEKWDTSLAIILFKIYEFARKNNIKVITKNMPSGVDDLMGLAFKVDRNPTANIEKPMSFIEKVGKQAVLVYTATCSACGFLKDILKSFKRLFTGEAKIRKIDFFFALEDCSYKAFSIVALISFMVGMILSFVGAVQLKVFGAEIYVASLVMVSMVRVMGALMTGIIMSGRTGASYAATIGTMQVNEEVDALKTMGFSEIDFLLLPRMISLMLIMPLLTVLADLLGVLGGALVGVFALDLPVGEYIKNSMNALFLNHFLIGVFHGFVFGIIIAMCGCYHGIKCEKDAESVGKSTTKAVVSSIVFIIVATAIITILCEAFKL